MKNLKFQTRLIIGFSVILFFSFSISLIAFFQIKNIHSHTVAIYKHPLAVSNSVRDINSGINAIHRSMKDVVLAENPNQLNESIQLVTLHDKNIKKAFKLVFERFLGDKKIVEDTYNMYINWEFIRNEVIQLKVDEKDTQAANITKRKGALHVNLLFKKTKVLTDFAQNKADEFYMETMDLERKSNYILISIVSLILLLSLLTAFLISQSISKPIHKFINDIRILYKKEGISDDFTNNKSEQEILNNTVLELKQAYRELEGFNFELDKKIEIRTHELQVAKDKAEENEQLKSAFLANMSHEIRTPLNSILGFSEFLKNDDLPKEKKDLYLNIIHSGGQRLLTIISDIVDISKIDAGQFSLHFETCMLNKLIDDLHKQFSLSKNCENVQLSTSTFFSDDIANISTDTTRLSQVLSNLLENAIKFTKKGSIDIGYTLTDGQLKFHVRDTGIGIPIEEQEIIFKRFRQTNQDKSSVPTGTGLGLSIAKGIIDLFKGEIWVDSTLGEGATFYFTIPYLPATKIDKKEESPANELLLQTAGKTILVAEDEPSNFIYLKELLNRYNYNVLHAKNGQEAVEFVVKQIHIDLILMDIKMPVMNGLQATLEIRKINREIPVIAQTAYAMANDRKRALEVGCNDYLSKPITSKMFTKIIHKHLSIADKSN